MTTRVLMTVDRPRVCRRIAAEVRAAAHLSRDNAALAIDTELDHQHLPVEHFTRPTDVLLVDGHASHALAAKSLRDDYAATIVAPVLIAGWCWAAREDYRAVLAHCIAVPQVVLAGLGALRPYTDAPIVYPPVLDAVATHGTTPAQLLPVLQPLLATLRTRRPWTATLLTPPTN